MLGGFRILALLPWLIAALAAPASAALIGFPDRTSWEAAASGGTLFLEDFESYTSDTSFRESAVDTGGFTIEQIGGATSASSVNMIDYLPFAFSGSNAIDGDAYALGWVNTFTSAYDPATSAFVEIVFDDPVFAWAADFNRTSNIGLLVFLLPEGGNPDVSSDWIQCLVCGIGFGDDFVGFVGNDGEFFTRVAILPASPDTGGGGARFGMDNVAWATVPEPQTAALLTLGLTGIAILGRRR